MLIVTSYENMTLCHDRCVSGCVSYRVPLGTCFSPPQLWPGDPQWGDNDVLDECARRVISVHILLVSVPILAIPN